MRLENIVWDTPDPRRLGRFWAAALGAEPLTDEPDGVEVRLLLADGVFLDLCFPLVTAPSTAPVRLRPELGGGAPARRRLVELGADDAGSVLTDPDGNPFRVVDDADPLAVLPLDSADPDRDVAFWAELTGWVPAAAGGPALRHPSDVGPRLEFRPEPGPKRGKSRLHLDVRRDAGDDELVAALPARGATPVDGYAGLPWVVFTDPSGNEFCVLDAPSGR